MPLRATVAATVLVATALWSCAGPQDSLDLEAWEAWRAERLVELAAEDGWLTLIGLYWLREGEPARFGISAENEIALPERPALAGLPGTLGTLLWQGERVTLTEVRSAELIVEGIEPAETPPVVLRSAAEELEPRALRIGSVELTVIERAGEIGVRARDRASERRGLVDDIPTFPPSASYRLHARFEPAPAGSTLRIANVVGQTIDQDNPGTLVFELNGREHRLETLATDTEGRYFLLVGDETNGVETYGGGRYLYVERRADGDVELDLNRLYNPPCVFTEFATCPLPPRGNRLPIRIEAGEKMWEGDLEH